MSKPFLPAMNPDATPIPGLGIGWSKRTSRESRKTRKLALPIREAAVAYSLRTSANVAAFVFHVSARTIVRWRKALQK